MGGEAPVSPRRPTRWAWWLFVASVCVLLVLAVQQLRARIPFPWDLYIWAESPFLTNLLKIENGQSVYSAPELANSFVYSPGLEYLTYAILKPFGHQLDIRYCRLVSVGFAVIGAVAFARCARRLSAALVPEDCNRLFTPVAAGLFFLVIHRNFTSDVPHPDNLQIAHSALVLLLVLAAIGRDSLRLAFTAVLFAGSGVFTKQVAAVLPVGAALGLAFGMRRGLRTSAALLLVGAATTAGGAAVLWSLPWGRFYTFDVPAAHGLELERLPQLGYFLFQESHRLLPLALLPPAVGAALHCRSEKGLRLVGALSLVAAFVVPPMITAFLKPMGAWNNLGIVAAWLLVPVVPWLFACLRADPIDADAAPAGRFARPALGFLAFGLVFSLWPGKAKPSSEHYRYAWTVQSQVGADLKAGKRVLVAHGTTFQLRNRDRRVPLDRANSCLELDKAGKIGQAGTLRRIEEGYYDRIYIGGPMWWEWYGTTIRDALDRHYRRVATIAGTVPRPWPEGFQYNLMGDMLVMEPAGPVARSKGSVAR